MNSELEKPLNLKIEKRQLENIINELKKRSKESINQNIFGFTTEREAKMVIEALNTFNVQSSHMSFVSDKGTTSINMVISEKDLQLLESINEEGILRAETSAVNYNHNGNVHLKNSIHSHLCERNNYVEINEEIFDFINTDWSGRDCHHVAVGQILAGAILVERQQVLLTNGCGLYNRKASVDNHRGRFGSSSMPTKDSKYKKVNIVVKYKKKMPETYPWYFSL